MEQMEIFQRMKDSIGILKMERPANASIEKTRLWLACFVGQAMMGDIIPIGYVDDIIDWLDEASASDIMALWSN